MCGAIAEGSVVLEKTVEEFARKYFEWIIQVQRLHGAAAPLLVQMSEGGPLISYGGQRWPDQVR